MKQIKGIQYLYYNNDKDNTKEILINMQINDDVIQLFHNRLLLVHFHDRLLLSLEFMCIDYDNRK